MFGDGKVGTQGTEGAGQEARQPHLVMVVEAEVWTPGSGVYTSRNPQHRAGESGLMGPLSINQGCAAKTP